MDHKPSVVPFITYRLLLHGAGNCCSSSCTHIECTGKLAIGEVAARVSNEAHGSTKHELMSSGKILRAAPYKELLSSCEEFQDLVRAHHDTAGCESVSRVKLFVVYTMIMFIMSFGVLFRFFCLVELGCGASTSIIDTLLNSLFRAPMLFYDPTPVGRILSQKYYFASAKELIRMNGTIKSALASHLAESIAEALTIRAFGEEDPFFSKNLEFIDANASADFNRFSANEWLIERLELLCVIIPSASPLAITLIQFDASSTERVEQYMHIPSEAPEVIEGNQPMHSWPTVGKVEIHDLKVRYRPNAPLVLRGINCIIEGGYKIGIVGRTGSGKTTLISFLFRLVEPTEGRVIVDDYDICKVGLHDLRLRFGIIPQDATLFSGSVRYNLDPLSKHTDHEIWELREAIQEKEEGLDSLGKKTACLVEVIYRYQQNNSRPGL
ncbi:hypothetical protein C1H46_005934 [Malus baccata]|uniref:ABC transporter domain-containing protein n=1 Tax=Malus baccata TaxID=106549 RepID=A0A540NBP2_MALBA|nr:hypothetical protein C1H46_005934 [Malus baccata]